MHTEGKQRQPPTVLKMTTEHLTNPVGLATALPRFSWQVKSNERNQVQSASQIQVWAAHSPEQLIWDSGKTPSNQQSLVPYEGLALESNTLYHWRVRVWDRKDCASAWSDNASFRTALLDTSEWVATWICPPEPTEGGTYFRGSFTATSVRDAVLYVSSRGSYERGPDPFVVCCEQQFGLARGIYLPYLNGTRVGDAEYESQPVDSRIRSLYRCWDVTSLIREGENVLGIKIGEDSDVIAQLVLTDSDGNRQVFCTSEQWLTRHSGTVRAERYNGETFDRRIAVTDWSSPAVDDSSWAQAISAGPAGRMEAAPNEPMRVVQVHEPVSVRSVEPGVHVFDFGQNITGRTKITCTIESGNLVTMTHGERLLEGRVDNSIMGARQTATLIGDGQPTTWNPQFTYSGFRWVEVSGLEEVPGLVAEEVHSDVPPVGTFSCGNQQLNRLHTANRQTQVNGLHGVPEDTPTREKRGWMADAHLAAQATMNNWNMAAFYTKWLGDIRDATKADGRVPDIVPNEPSPVWDHRSDPAWAAATALIPYYAWKNYGDSRIIERHYPYLVRWLNYLETTASGSLLTMPNHTWGDDWLSLETTDGTLFRSCFYYWAARIAAEFAVILNKDADTLRFEELNQAIATAINEVYFDGSKSYGPSQFANAFPLILDLPPEEAKAAVADNLASLVEHGAQGHFTGGLPGIKYIPDALEQTGRNDLILAATTTTEFPGWGYMLEQGPGTIWESWQGEISLNHPMFTCIDTWLYSAVAGIGQSSSSVGFQELEFYPRLTNSICSAEASISTPFGEASIEWRRLSRGLQVKIEVPFGATATVILPNEDASTLLEGGISVAGARGILSLTDSPRGVEIQLGSGHYFFESTSR